MNIATQLVETFTYQSYFDDVLLQTAILAQPPGSAIVESTLKRPQIPGVGVALHPSSECPIAIRFFGKHDSGTIILTPGMKVMTGAFDRFEWGLPYGWLGGGTAVLYALHDDAELSFQTSSPDVLFHRTRIQIVIGAAPDLATAPVNWPVAFPWANAFSGVAPQSGNDVLVVQPTHTLFRLRVSQAAPVSLMLAWRGTQDFDTDLAGVPALVDYTVTELSFPGVPATSPTVAFPVAWMDDPLVRLGGRASIVNIYDPAGTLAEDFVDVLRYGRFA